MVRCSEDIAMVPSKPESPEKQDSPQQQGSPWQPDSLRKEHLLAIVLIVMIIIVVAVLSVCMYKYWRKHWRQFSFTQKPGQETIHSGEYNHNIVASDERKGKKQIRTSPRPDETGGKSDGYLHPPKNTDLNSSNSRSSSAPASPILGQIFKNMLAPFQFGYQQVQPTNSDLPPFSRMCKRRSLPLPMTIPEAPQHSHEDLGKLRFSISYDVFDCILEVCLLSAQNLPDMDLFTSTSDPYVKLFLSPGRKETFKTKIKKRSLNPTWNEKFTFQGLPHEQVKQKTLFFEVFDYDRFSRDDAIGATELTLGSVTLQKEPLEIEKPLQTSTSRGRLGDLLISMSYNPTAGKMNVVIMKINQLCSMDMTGKSDAYIKVHQMQAGHQIDKKKTSVQKRSLNPVWNELMEFEAPITSIREMSLEFVVMDHEACLPDRYIGKVLVGYSTTGTSLEHWRKVLNNPNKPLAYWHIIRKY